MPSPTISTRRLGESHSATSAGAEHHLLRIDGCLSDAVARKEGAVDRQRDIVNTVRNQRHHRWPNAAGEVLQPAVEADRVRWREMQAPRGEISLDQRTTGRHRSFPDGKSGFGALGCHERTGS